MTLTGEEAPCKPPAYPSDWTGTPDFDSPICRAIGGRPQIGDVATGSERTAGTFKPLFENT